MKALDGCGMHRVLERVLNDLCACRECVICSTSQNAKRADAYILLADCVKKMGFVRKAETLNDFAHNLGFEQGGNETNLGVSLKRSGCYAFLRGSFDSCQCRVCFDMGAFNVDLYLGIDLSTQSCKGVLMSDTLQVVGNAVVQFDNDLPRYGTKIGVLLKGNGVVVSPTLMVCFFTCIHA